MSEQSDRPNPESFTDFKNSFAYGSRTDLNFKFLKNLSEADAASFFQGLFTSLAETFDDGNLPRLYEYVFSWQVRAYAGPSRWQYADGPFSPLTKPLSQARIALLTSSGHFIEGDDPEPFGVKGMTQAEAAARVDDFLKEEPRLSIIPADTAEEQLRVRHCGYDIHGTQADPNVAFPLARLRDLVHEGVIGELAPQAYSFVGACAQLPLLKQFGPKWVELLKAQSVDAAVLVPV